MRIGLLKTDDVAPALAAEHGEYTDMFMALLSAVDENLTYAVYDVQRGHYPDHIDECDGYLMTGSKVGVYDDDPWIAPLMDFVRELHRRRKRQVGICFGHQLIAHALGGRAEKSDRGWGIGAHPVTVSDAGTALKDLGGSRASEQAPSTTLQLLYSHQDQVVAAPPGAVVTLKNAFCPIAGLQIDDCVLTFQGHPEFSKAYLRALMARRQSVYPSAVYQRALNSLDAPLDNLRVGRVIVDFLKGRSR